MEIRYLFIIIALFIPDISKAQTDQKVYNLQNVIPPSPNASSLGKYVDWPVNLYKGLPQINIPIYELKGRSTSVPISVSYHASGIKVGENASSVGLGWALNAGGVITRSVRGLPDDADGAGYLWIRQQYNNPNDLSSGTIIPSRDSLFQIAIANGTTESEPDLYMFNALGKSFKFYFSGDGSIVTQPYSNLKITNSATDSSWTVLLEDGTKLIFGGGNKFTERSASQSFETYSFISSWYLKSITTTSGEVINFKYTATNNVTLDSYYYEADYYTSSGVYDKPIIRKALTQSLNFLNLASIESDLGRVDFDTIARLDLPGSVAVSKIKIFSKLSGSYIKSYRFYYGYSIASNSNVYTGGYTSSLYRLKLNRIEEIPSDNGAHQYWQFDYNPRTLPSRKSFAQDHWGYYNGAVNNTTFLPFAYEFSPALYPVGIRSADSAAMQAEMLTKITYLTGGYSQFDYEPNGYPANEEQFKNTNFNPHLFLTYNQSNFSNIDIDTLVVSRAQYFRFDFRGVFSTVYMNDYGPTTVLASAVLKNAAGATLSSIGLNKGNNLATLTSPYILLPAGTYTFTISSISPQGDFGSTTQTVDLAGTYTYLASQGFKVVNHPVGGVRLRSLFYYDKTDTAKSIKKYYTYENPYEISPLDTTTDYVTNTTQNTYNCDIGGGSTGGLTSSVTFRTRTSSTKFSLGNIQGGTIGYGKVTERFGPVGENGKKVYYYTNTPDLNVTSAKAFPYPAAVSFDYERGKLLEEHVFTAGNVLVKKTRNTYEFTKRRSIQTYKAAYKFDVASACMSFIRLYEVIQRSYYQDQTNQVKLSSTTDVNYNVATGDSLVTTVNHFYDDTLNMQSTRTSSLDSKGNTVLSYKRTALEKADINSSIPLTTIAAAALDTMVARNMVGSPVETETYVQNVVVNKALTNFKVQTSKLVLPDNVMVQNGTNAIETRVLFTKYSSAGNLLEQQKTGDQKHSYIWDYSSTYPIAEVTNGDSANIAYTSFEADAAGSWTIAASAREASRYVTGIKSYNLSGGAISKSGLTTGRTYRLSYWTTNTSALTSITGNKSGYPAKLRSATINGISWTCFEHKITGVTTISISGTGYIDELRLYPDTAQMKTYAYKPLIGLSNVCDENNKIDYYEYDGAGRLHVIRDLDMNVKKEIFYNYDRQVLYYNIPKSGTYTRDCGSGFTGSSVTYVVEDSTYFSQVSQIEADSLAQNDVTLNGQTYANVNGTCTAVPAITITATNNTALAGFTATCTNTGTSVQTVLTIPAAGGTVGTLPTGTYNITLAKSGNTTVKYIYKVCAATNVTAVTATFSNVSISSTCKTIIIDSID